MTPADRDFPDAPDEFLRDPIESYVQPVLQDLAQQASLTPPALIQALGPRYTIVRELGQGGMARVYLAFDHSLQRQVAVKVLQPEISDAITAERFLREIEMTAQLHHSRIVPVHDRGEAAGLLYYIMQHFEGGSLRERLEGSGPLSISDTIAVAKDVAGALDYAHTHGIVHRDIKPENILLEAEGAFVADFGVARLVEAERKKLTQTGMVIGTPYYMSPEQADAGQAVDGRSDVYALGCVVYEMLAGEPPFTGPDRRAVAAKHAAAPTPDLTLVRKTVTADMQHVIETALQKTPADRYPTAGAFVTALERGSLSGAVTRPVSKRRTIAIAATVGLLAVAAIALSTRRGSPPVVLDPEKLVIVPITVHDSGLIEWRMSTVDWLSRTLDGAGPIRTVPPSVIAKRVAGKDVLSPIEVARGLNAGLVLDGSLVRAGHDSLRLIMTMREVQTNGILSEISVTDLESRFDRLMDSVTLRLLLGLRRSRATGPMTSASIGSSSLPAIKAFLQGEESFRRLDLSNALAKYEEAVRLDSNFAPALRNLANTISSLQLTGDESTFNLIRRAIRNNKRLGARDSLLLVLESVTLEGHFGNRHSQEILAILEQLAARYEDDAEVWDLYANAVLNMIRFVAWNPPTAFTPSVGRDLFEHVVKLDSLNVDALATSANYSIALGDSDFARLRLRQCVRAGGTGLGAKLCTVDLAFLDRPNDPASLALLDSAALWVQIQAMIPFTEIPDGNETGTAIARRVWEDRTRRRLSRTDIPLADQVARVLSAHGHLREARHYALLADGYGPSGLAGQIAALGGVPRDSMMMLWRSSRTLLAQEGWGVMWWLLSQSDTLALHTAILQADAAVRHGELSTLGSATYYREVGRAHLALARHDTAQALQMLLAIPDSLCRTCTLHRLTVARLLAAAGRLDEAARWLTTTPVIWYEPGPVTIMWCLERARVAERLGNRMQAIEDYRYVAGMWQHADSVLLPYVAESRRALERLGTDR